MEATVCKITPTAKTIAAPIMPFLIVAQADLTASSSPLATIYLIPPQTIIITATTTDMVINHLAILSINEVISPTVTAEPDTGTVGLGKTAAKTKSGKTNIANPETAKIFLDIFITHLLSKQY
jgi:hypothetical protein